MDRLLDLDDLTTSILSGRLERIDAYRASWVTQDSLTPDLLTRLAHEASVQSIGSSTRIEGSTLSDVEVATLLSGMQVTKLASRDEQEVAGYSHTLRLIYGNYADISLGRSHVLGLHKQLLRFSTRDEHHRGAYKQHSNRVVATDAAGRQKTIFRTTEPMFVEREMDALFAWYDAQLATPTYHPLVTVAAVVYEFLSIHPFQDGNGRLSRLMTTLLLLRHGYDFVTYASLERVIERRKHEYYRVLMSAQRYRGTEHEVIGAWVLFFAKCLVELTDDLERAIAGYPAAPTPPTSLEEPAMPAYLSIKEEKVLTYFDTHDRLSVREVDALVPEVSRSSTKNYLRRLVETGHLRRRGRGRATVYERLR